MKNGLKKFWNIITADNDTVAEVRLYGEIVSNRPSDFFTGQQINDEMIVGAEFAADLQKLRNKSEITIHLNSVGGEVYAGVAIHNALKALTGHKTVVIDGLAASAATLIACAGDTVKAYAGSTFMIHSPLAFLFGHYNVNDMKQELDGLKACVKSAAEIYAAKSGRDVEEMKALMTGTKETWLVGQEIIDRGFADELITTAAPLTMGLIDGAKKFVSCGNVKQEVKSFDELPAFFKGCKIEAGKDEDDQTQTDQEKGENDMDKIETVEQLKTAYPSLIAEIEQQAATAATAKADTAKAEAVKAERERLNEIEMISATIADKAMLQEAKFGATACDARELAFRALTAENKAKAAQLENMKADATASGADKVGAAPAPDETDKAEQERVAREKTISNAVAAVNAAKRK